jgi:hypothetical protein
MSLAIVPRRSIGLSFDTGTEPAHGRLHSKGRQSQSCWNGLAAVLLMEREMVTYFFHVDTGKAELDGGGTQLASLAEVRDEAVAMIAGILHNGEGVGIWAGAPLKVWVTDEPLGAGRTFFTLSLLVS